MDGLTLVIELQFIFLQSQQVLPELDADTIQRLYFACNLRDFAMYQTLCY